MRRLLASALAGAAMAGAILASATSAFADETTESTSPTCYTNNNINTPLGVSVTNPAGPANTSGTEQVCVEPNSTVPWPITGTITASGNATTASGYVVADGNPSNPGALAGYIGVEGNGPATGGSGLAVVGCGSGNYYANEGDSNPDGNASNNENDDNVVWSTSNPTPNVSTSGSCSAVPSAPSVP